MAGHSALLFLEAVKSARLISFDLGDAPWSRPAAGARNHAIPLTHKLQRSARPGEPTNKSVHVTAICRHLGATDIMAQAFGERFEAVFGLSNNTVPTYAREHPSLDCDVLFVDGAKFGEQRWLDLQNFRQLTRPGAVLFYDEASTLECVRGEVSEDSPLCQGNDGAAKAYNRAAQRGLVKVIDCRWAIHGVPGGGYLKKGVRGDGSCVAEYQ